MADAINEFTERQLELIDLERQTEIDQSVTSHAQCSIKELVRQGVILTNLRLAGQRTGLFGRSILVFESFWTGKDLSSHTFTPGDIAGICLSSGDSGKDQLLSGIINKSSTTSISVACDESWEQINLDGHTKYRLRKLANDVTYKRIKRCMKDLSRFRSGPSAKLIDVLFDKTEPSLPYGDGKQTLPENIKDFEFFNTNLDASQKEAVVFSLNQRELSIIHGPPGTGKTTTVVEVIRQAAKQKLKILTCASSNIAVDNLVERLAVQGVNVVRLGHPARLLQSAQNYTLDAVLTRSDDGQINQEIRTEIAKKLGSLSKLNKAGEKRHVYSELKDLRKDLRKREESATKRVLSSASVVLATLTSATNDGPLRLLDNDHFDIVVIDECSQALEASCWLALLRAPRCILAGDHLQLPPTIMSEQAAKAGLSITLMERLLKLYGDKVMRMLCCQYRMHHDIMAWPSKQLYDNKLIAHSSVEKHLLKDLPSIDCTDLSSIPVLYIDTAGCGFYELDLPDEMSKGNEGEADLVKTHVQAIIDVGVKPEDIAVIAPYNLQVELLRLRLNEHKGLEVKSVDGFQGREKEAVVISMVRSNDRGEVGFLSEDRRINVAITRARRHLCIIGDSGTISQHPFLDSMVEYLNDHAEVRSAQEYVQDGLVELSDSRPEHLQEKLDNKTAAKKKKQKDDQGKKIQAGNKSHQGKAHVEYSEAENNARRSKFRVELQKFEDNEFMNEYRFPASLTSYERMMVHEIAESLKLIHISTGEKDNRHIIVTRPVKPKRERQRKDIAENDVEAEDIADMEDENKFSVSVENEEVIEKTLDEVPAPVKETSGQNHESCCPKCNKVVPKTNLDLHMMRCPVSRSATQKPSSANSGGGARPKVKNVNHIKSSKLSKISGDEDFDTIVAAALQDNTQCTFTKCKASITTLGQRCEFCTQVYCLSHHIPEVHGCGDQAKKRARQVILRDGVLHRGSGVPSKKPDPTKRANLQRKLNKKLDDMASDRTRKSKKKH